MDRDSKVIARASATAAPVATTLGDSNGPSALASLRCHAYAVTTMHFSSDGLTLASGDEGGWVVYWSLVTRRPLAVWRAHEKSIVRVKWTSSGKLLTHGRDNKLTIWRLSRETSTSSLFNTEVPQRNSDPNQWRKPWMAHTQDVNTLNFCGADVCGSLICTPNTTNSSRIDVYHLDDGQLSRPVNGLATSLGDDKVGILMAMVIVEDRLVAGYESGHIAVFNRDRREVFVEKLHKHPVMSIAIYDRTVVSTGADATITKLDLDSLEHKQFNTRHSGLASVSVRSDGQLVATAGWDGMVRVFKLSNFKPLAAFRGGRQDGVTHVTFSPVAPTTAPDSSSSAVRRKEAAVASTNYLAVAGKDGRIGLYDLY